MPVGDSHPVPIAFLNGQIIPFEEARLPVYDLAMMQGASITERMRTVWHQPFQVPEHLNRLKKSLELVGWNEPAGVDVDQLTDQIEQVVERNCSLIKQESDLSLVVFISAGQSIGDANGLIERSQPTVCVYSAPLPFARWSTGYREGVSLVIPPIRQVPSNVVNPLIKMRSRLHWQMADQFARQEVPNGMALILDQEGCITETSSGNLILVKNGKCLTPLREKTLAGITRENIESLCQELSVPFKYGDLTVADLEAADEVFLTSSTYGILPVRSVDDSVVRSACPGPITIKLTEAYAAFQGIDFVQQAFNNE